MKFSVEFDRFVFSTIFWTVHLKEKKESEKQFPSVISHIGKTKQQAKEECLPFEWTLWRIFRWMELHFFSPRNMKRNQSYHLIKSFRCRWFPASLSSTTGIMKAKMKYKITKDQNLTSFWSRVLQMRCKKFVNNGNKNRTAVTS